MRVLGVRRRPRPTPCVDEVFAAEQLNEMLSRCDAVIVAAAFTPETAGMFGPAAFAVMKPGAMLINVSRGGIIDEAALCAALNEGRLAAAASDVFVTEPLPVDSPLWGQPKLFISAHDAVGVGDYAGAVLNRFVENFAAHVHCQPLKGVVDPRLGY